MAKLTLNTIGSRYGSIDALNSNFDAIETALENTLSRDGTAPNSLGADLDMDSNSLLNVNELNGFNVTELGPDINTVVNNIDSINLVADNIGDIVATAGTMSVVRFSGNSSTTVFTLPTPPVSENNTQVYISGIYQQKNTYSISGTSLTFNTAPATGTNNIEVVTISTLPLGTITSDLVSYLPAGTGAVLTNVQERLREHDAILEGPGGSTLSTINLTGSGPVTLESQADLILVAEGKLRLEGTVEATTPTSGDNSRKVATTAFVTAAVSGGGGGSVAASSVTNTPAGNIAATNVQAALNELDTEKAPLASPTFTGTVSGITKAMVGLDNVDNTTDAGKPVSTATQTALNAKQATLVSGTNIKTVNSNSLLGSGDVAVQATLVSGTNIKTINSTSLLGSGDITVGTTAGSGVSSIAIGTGATATADYSIAIGLGSGATAANTPSGNGAVAIGGSRATGGDSLSMVINNNTATYGSNANGAISIGGLARASGTNGVSLGVFNVASGTASFASGYFSAASGQYSFTSGGYSSAAQIGKYAHSGGAVATAGVSQMGSIVLYAATTGTAVAMTSNGAAVATTNQLIVATNQAMAFTGTVIGKQSGSANIAAYKIEGTVVNNGGTVTMPTGTLTAIGTPAAGWTAPTIAVDNTRKGITLTSGFNAATTISWTARIDSSEILLA